MGDHDASRDAARRDPAQSAGSPTAAETAQLGVLADRLQRIEAEKARLAAAEHDVYAEAMVLAETQRARIRSRDVAERDMPVRSIAAELAAATRTSDRTTQARMGTAARLVGDFPATLAALREARISVGHVRAVLDAGTPITDPAARATFERVVLERAVTLSVGRTRAYATQVAERLNPATMTEQHRTARDDRSVWVTDRENGMSELGISGPTVLIRGIHDRLTEQAKTLRTETAAMLREAVTAGQPTEGLTDERTIDQLRADIATDLLLTGAPVIDPTRDRSPGGLGAIRAHIQVTVPVTTLTGTTGSGADLDGRTPIDPDTARILAGNAPGWDRVLTHPITGTVLTVDRYTPSAEQRRHLVARDQHCRFPGCRTPAHRCDTDHTHDHAKGGKTEICNLACLCTRHHTLKHATTWKVRQLPDGILEWTSPTGRTYTDQPPPRVVFTPHTDPPPF
ncbi:DUF222 domain-containing protein [Microbacterium sp. X-17]|uniref:HNH endonuclease signature motif containing protein n=1 Tax=Microbacterium sp. X-17 TaxID=3144404 RepID=UPI0031F49187